MAVVKKVRKALEGGNGQPRATRGLPLTAQVAALSTGGGGGGGQDGNAESANGRKEVVVLGTGRAIEKTLNVAAWFQRQPDCKVNLRTRSVAAVDDVVLGTGDEESKELDPDEADGEMEEGGDGADVEDYARVRMISCLEVAVWLR
jgi:ribonuclease P/MRP protein subunit POP7